MPELLKRVLVTGGGGFIGRACLPILRVKGYEVHAAELAPPTDAGDEAEWHAVDLMSRDAVANLLEQIRPTHLLHLAWYTAHGLFYSSAENLTWVEASLHLLRRFADSGGRRVVAAGTCTEYGPSAGPCREHETPLAPATLYGTCKHGLHLVTAAFARQAGFDLAWGRLFFLYGPGEKPGRLVPSTICSLVAGQRVVCRHGNHVRDFLHVRDAAAAMVELLDGDVTGPVNIASGQKVMNGQLVSMIARRLGREDLVEIRQAPSDCGDPPSIVADVQRLTQEVGFSPGISLEAGLQETIEWWKAHGTTT